MAFVYRIARSWHGFGDACRETGCTVRRAVGAVGSVLSVVPQVSRSWPQLPPITIWFMDVYGISVTISNCCVF